MTVGNKICPKRLVPRFLYHITTVPAYEKMCEKNMIALKMSNGSSLDGVYMFDLQNFFKRWNSANNKGVCLQDAILRHIRGKADNPDLVMLKIPTENLDRKKLFIRSLQRVFGIAQQESHMHRIFGEPASYAPYFKKRKEPIEYVYKGDILNFEKIGQANSDIAKHGSVFGIRQFFLELLKGTKEAIGADKFIVYYFNKK